MKTRRLVLAILAALIVACAGGGGVMESGPPPQGWERSVLDARADRDRYMREDPETPLRPADVQGFRGLSFWPPDPRYRFVGPVEINERLERFTIVTTSGKPRPCERYGRVRFRLDGATRTLEVYRLLDVDVSPGRDSFFLPFLDETSGKETYRAGRYVDLEGPRGGPYVLDFNLAYNPSCAYGSPERFACPVTPKENKLGVRIEAGERGFVAEVKDPS